jgi:hypothetical protein
MRAAAWDRRFVCLVPTCPNAPLDLFMNCPMIQSHIHFALHKEPPGDISR